MTDLHMPTLRQAQAADWAAVKQLLQASGLPVQDLGPDRLDGFLVAEDSLLDRLPHDGAAAANGDI